MALLEDGEPPAFLEVNRDGDSRFVIAVDHASRRIPKRLQNLGLARPIWSDTSPGISEHSRSRSAFQIGCMHR